MKTISPKLTVYQQCVNLRHYVLKRAAEVMNYPWDDKFIAACIKEIYPASKIKTVDITKLTAQQMDELGFGRWSANDTMRLIPLWLYPWLPEVMETKCIDGKVQTLKKADMDTDNRYGYLAYGINPSLYPEEVS